MEKKGFQLVFTTITITASLCALKEFAYCFVSPLSSQKQYNNGDGGILSLPAIIIPKQKIMQ